MPVWPSGLGVEVLRGVGSDTVVGHSGVKEGYKAVLAVVPARGIFVALAINDGDVDEAVALTPALEALAEG